MNIKQIAAMDSWDWPEGVHELLLKILHNPKPDAEELELAVQMAGEYAVINDELAEALCKIALDSDRDEDVRAAAAISFGPAIEICDSDGFDEGMSDAPISEAMYKKIHEALHTIHRDATASIYVRRRALEASVRGAQPWHADAVRAAYASDDPKWKLTALFCMRYVDGFENEIIASLTDADADIVHEAVRSAGELALDKAWKSIAKILAAPPTNRELFLAAIAAAGNYGHADAMMLLQSLMESEDDEIADAANDALISPEALED